MSPLFLITFSADKRWHKFWNHMSCKCGISMLQASKDCVAKTLKRLEENIHGPVWSQKIYINFPDKSSLCQSFCMLPCILIQNKVFHCQQVLKHLLYLMRLPDKSVQRRVALTLSHLCLPDDQRTIFIENNGTWRFLCLSL
jgi:hypothetical protein